MLLAHPGVAVPWGFAVARAEGVAISGRAGGQNGKGSRGPSAAVADPSRKAPEQRRVLGLRGPSSERGTKGENRIAHSGVAIP